MRKFGQSLYDYLKILNFLLKRPAGLLILELLNEDRRNEKEKVFNIRLIEVGKLKQNVRYDVTIICNVLLIKTVVI